MACPYDHRTTSARQPEESRDGGHVDRRHPDALPPNQPFREVNMNHVMRPEQAGLAGEGRDLDTVPGYLTEQKQQRRVVGQLIRARAHQDPDRPGLETGTSPECILDQNRAPQSQ